MVRIVSKALTGLVGEQSIAFVVEPAQVAALPMPCRDSGEAHSCESFELEFAYGTADETENPIGRFPCSAGRVISFVCLNREVLIDNPDVAANGEIEYPCDLKGPDQAVTIANRSSMPVTFRFFNAGPTHFGLFFERSLLEESLQAGEQRAVVVPLSHCA